VATSHSSSSGRIGSLKDNPPNASSPQGFHALEGGAESVPELALAPAPELPLVLRQILQGYQRGPTGSLSDEAVQEKWALYLGEFLARANSSSREAEKKSQEHQALAEELALVKEQMAKQAKSFFIRETALNQELDVLREAELTTNKRLHDEGQKYTTLLSKVVPLRVELEELKAENAVNKEKMTTLEERSVDPEVLLGKVEAELTEKTEAFEKAKAELTIQAEDFEKAKAELLDDAADAFVVGFEEALAQVVCKHPEMDASLFLTANCVIDGQIVPRQSRKDIA